MAKKKKKSTAAAAPKDQSTTNAAVVTSSFAGCFAAIIIGAALFIALGYNFKSLQTAPSSFPNKAAVSTPITTTTAAAAQSKGELFLNWFVDNGGIFHPISTDSSSAAVNDNNNVQITIQKFDGMGWGLAAVVSNNATLSSTSTMNRVNDNVHDDDNNICENTQSTKESCSSNPSSTTAA